MPDERCDTADTPCVNKAHGIAFSGLGHSGRIGEITVKRIATTLLVAGLLATPMLALAPPAAAAVNIGISVGIAPPVLPVYAQPVVPGPGYLWTPGYWAWSGGYYWVPGTWVMPPEVGLLWTPGWWGWDGGLYHWHRGYWGTHVGFYGGVNYGYGYFGTGYSGGHWRGRDFYYNRAINNINVTRIHNVYVNRTVINNYRDVNRVSYNGGRGGITARPSAEQARHASQHRYSPTSMQTRQREVAMHNPAQRVKTNEGHPAVFATQHAGRFHGPHAVRSPGESRSHMMAAPNRTHAVVTAAHEHSTRTSGHAGPVVEAPHDRTRSMMPADQSFRTERAEPRPERGESNEGPRGESAKARRNGPPAHPGKRGKPRHEKQKPDNGGHR